MGREEEGVYLYHIKWAQHRTAQHMARNGQECCTECICIMYQRINQIYI